MQALVLRLGYSSFSYLELPQQPLVGMAIPFHITTLRADFYASYLREDFASYDPVLTRSVATNKPFTWADCPEFNLCGGRRGRKTKARRVMEVAHDFGYTQGYVVPVRAVDRRGALVSSIVSLAWRDSLKSFSTPEAMPRWLRLVALSFHERMLELRGTGSSEPPGRCSFTDRERDCMSWAGRGKTAVETAMILGIGARTIEFHLQNAMKKLGVHSKPHAIASALRRGLIAP